MKQRLQKNAVCNKKGAGKLSEVCAFLDVLLSAFFSALTNEFFGSSYVFQKTAPKMHICTSFSAFLKQAKNYVVFVWSE